MASSNTQLEEASFCNTLNSSFLFTQIIKFASTLPFSGHELSLKHLNVKVLPPIGGLLVEWDDEDSLEPVGWWYL